MQIIVFEGHLPMGDSKGATMLFAQDFRVEQCALQMKTLTIECEGVDILGQEDELAVSSHPVYFDHTLLGRLSQNRTEFTILPMVDAGVHRVRIEVSPYPGLGLCDDFTLRRITFACD